MRTGLLQFCGITNKFVLSKCAALWPAPYWICAEIHSLPPFVCPTPYYGVKLNRAFPSLGRTLVWTIMESRGWRFRAWPY